MSSDTLSKFTAGDTLQAIRFVNIPNNVNFSYFAKLIFKVFNEDITGIIMECLDAVGFNILAIAAPSRINTSTSGASSCAGQSFCKQSSKSDFHPERSLPICESEGRQL